MNLTKYVEDWFERGNEDLNVAQILLKEKGLSNPVCFHCQQSAEKYLKGFLAFHEKHVRKIHDLNLLFEECVKLNPALGDLKDYTEFLNQFYVEARYPDDYIQFSGADAQKAFEAAEKIRLSVIQIIK